MSATAFNVGAGGKLALVNKQHFTAAGSWTTPEDYKLISVAWLYTGASTPTAVTFSAGKVVVKNERVGFRNWSYRNCATYASLALDVPKNTRISWNWNEDGGLDIYCFK